MVRRIPENELQSIEAIINRHPGGISADDIDQELKSAYPRRTLNHRLTNLVKGGRIKRQGAGRATRYLPKADDGARVIAEQSPISVQGDLFMPLSKEGKKVQDYVSRQEAQREYAWYDRDFLDAYIPNKTYYLSKKEREHLRGVGTPKIGQQPAGTYAKQLLSRLLIDLSWNSSRLEGNTYSLLDTKRLIDLGEEAEGKDRLEAQMILNHKDAIEFLVSSADEIRFNRYTILNLHAILSNNLLGDPSASGRLRHIEVGIQGSVFEPLAVPQAIKECFDEILSKASQVTDPFEQSLFVMVQLPYLQPFDDVNKRVSRLSANIPFIKGNFAPLSFADVTRELYTQAILGVYEMNRVEMLKDLYIWAYGRSAARYAAVRQSLGEPDPFKLRYRSQIKDLISHVIKGRMNKKEASSAVSLWASEMIPQEDRNRAVEIAENELLSIHEGNFARYAIRPSEFAAWQEAWSARTE